MIGPPQARVPHLRDSFLVAKVGIVRSTTAPANSHPTETSKNQSGLLLSAPQQHRVPHPLQSHRKPGSPPALPVGWKGRVIEQSETAVACLNPTEASKVEVE
jgi:hypothetical protein